MKKFSCIRKGKVYYRGQSKYVLKMCLICGDNYKPTSGIQKYCGKCVKRGKTKLSTLLKKVNKLFPIKQEKIDSYSFVIARVNRGFWTFNVVNSWLKWLDKGYKTDFGLYVKPEWAIEEFLDYVKKNKIKVKKLCD